MSKKRVLLLNPPGEKQYTRDYFCGDEAKGAYSWPPTDLIYASAKLHSFECIVIDAMVEGLSKQQTLKLIRDFAPDYIISLCSSVSFPEDIDFFKQCYSENSCQIMVSGDYPRSQFKEVLEKYPCIDSIMVNFAINDLSLYLAEGETNLNIVNRSNLNSFKENYVDQFTIGVPQFEIFKLNLYIMPLIKNTPFTTFITEFGCKYGCTFCFYEKTKYVRRNLDDIKSELDELQRLGIRNLFINDPSFYSDPKHGEKVTTLLSSYDRPFSYLCGMRVDNIDDEIANSLKKSGCFAVAFGVETSNEETQKKIRKNLAQNQIERAFNLCKKRGIKTLAHFILGLTDESFEDQRKHINFALKINPNFATFNVATPVWNTTFREELNAKGVFNNDISVNISSDEFAWQNKQISTEQIKHLKSLAFRKFYIRPSFIFKLIFSIRNLFQLRVILGEVNLRLKSLGRNN
ncbi:hypothetical protein A9Q84_19170 [Halobacteriovorax marinus]|uniref:Radical SAM core domain-containing protein n=1 Tax=Halobacteriovorax marinus TaxID=97084 RepID=A0A1Y5F2D5_9BACT|nr:hypothetical protein A9Q84_19170 [Halobacteriovorax marinus]